MAWLRAVREAAHSAWPQMIPSSSHRPPGVYRPYLRERRSLPSRCPATCPPKTRAIDQRCLPMTTEMRGAERGAASGRVVWVTAMGGAVDHAVEQGDLAAGVGCPGRGFWSVCGDRFWAAPMVAEPGAACCRCARFLRARASLRGAEERVARRESPLGRWLSAVLAGSGSRRGGDAAHVQGSPLRRAPRAGGVR